jgi:hypothetical protein
MSEHPEWIPACIELNDSGGNWGHYLEIIYKRFCDDLVFRKVQFLNGYVAVRKIPESNGKGYGFWHCISEGREEQQRIPDMERCKRIGWIRAIIEHSAEAEVDCWQNMRGSERNHLLWYKEQYLIILAERKATVPEKKYYLLKTAYYTTGNRRMETLRKERDAYKKTDAAQKGDV